jgi:large subunit ribosomal protein L23
MIIEPVLTEKSLENAKKGSYTFFVDSHLTKYQAKKLINETFAVHVTEIRTINLKKEAKRTYSGRVKIVKAKKKVIVTLKDKEKIDIFEAKSK